MVAQQLLGAAAVRRAASRTATDWRAAPPATPEAVQLSLLAQPTLQTIERYYLAIALLRRAGSGVLTQAELEKRCQQMAERMLTLYGFYSPEFHDRSLFEGFLGLLRRRGVLRTDGGGQAGVRRGAGPRSPTTRSWCCQSSCATASCRSCTAEAGNAQPETRAPPQDVFGAARPFGVAPGSALRLR